MLAWCFKHWSSLESLLIVFRTHKQNTVTQRLMHQFNISSHDITFLTWHNFPTLPTRQRHKIKFSCDVTATGVTNNNLGIEVFSTVGSPVQLWPSSIYSQFTYVYLLFPGNMLQCIVGKNKNQIELRLWHNDVRVLFLRPWANAKVIDSSGLFVDGDS